MYIGGLIIIFLYISGIAFNEFNIIKNYKNIINKILFILLIRYLIKPLIMVENFNFEDNLFFEDNFYLINIFIIPNNLIIYFILFILFFILILII